MCGIVAIFDCNTGGIVQSDLERFEVLMHVNMLRGKDSTGVMTVKGGKVAWMKSLGSPAELFSSVHITQHTREHILGASTLVGHCRSATKGTVTARNAHPFTIDHITLVKNGTVTGERSYDWPVDSMWAAKVLASEGSQAFIDKATGGYAMLWFDAKDRRIHVLRNNDRPLYKATITNKEKTINQVWIASELGFIRFVAGRYGLTVSKEEYFAAYTEYKISVDKSKFHMVGTVLEPPKPPVSNIVQVVKQLPLLGNKKDKKEKLYSYTYNGENFWPQKSVKFVPVTWQNVGKSKKNTSLAYMKYVGLLWGDSNGAVEVTGVVEIEPDMIDSIDNMVAKIESIKKDEFDLVTFHCHQPFFNMKGDVANA